MAAQFSQHGRLIAAAGADLQGAALRSRLGQLGHQGHDVRLRDGLPFADRQGAVFVGQRPDHLRYEPLPVDSAHDFQNLSAN